MGRMAGEPTKKLPFRLVLGYGLGHVFNDICASLWFTYLLIFLQKVLKFNSADAGLVMLTGQLADGVSTTFVGLIADRAAQCLPLCRRYGRRKSWHLLGSICVAVSFPFIFLPCLPCSSDSSSAFRLLYFLFFVVLFQFGWAATQISHLALITDLTGCEDKRTSLTAIRYGFTVVSSISVYGITWAFFGMGEDKEISQSDQPVFRNIMLVCIGIGITSTTCFHILVKETAKDIDDIGAEVDDKKDIKMEEMTLGLELDTNREVKSITWWLRLPSLYLVALVYMATRLFLNISQSYIPFYIQDSLKVEDASMVARVPLVMFAASFVASFPTKIANRYVGRHVAWLLGAGVGLTASITVFFAEGVAMKQWGIYLVAVAFGASSSALLITSLGMTADLIGEETSSSALVFGLMSLTDKVANGLGIVLIQGQVPCVKLTDRHPLSNCPQTLKPFHPPELDPVERSSCLDFYQLVLFYTTAGAALLGAVGVALLIFVKAVKRDKKEGRPIKAGAK